MFVVLLRRTLTKAADFDLLLFVFIQFCASLVLMQRVRIKAGIKQSARTLTTWKRLIRRATETNRG